MESDKVTSIIKNYAAFLSENPDKVKEAQKRDSDSELVNILATQVLEKFAIKIKNGGETESESDSDSDDEDKESKVVVTFYIRYVYSSRDVKEMLEGGSYITTLLQERLNKKLMPTFRPFVTPRGVVIKVQNVAESKENKS